VNASATREVIGDGLLLVGDAAGLAYAESGEGIRPAVESALIAAEVIAAARGNYRRERLIPYRDLLVRRFGERPGRARRAGWLPAGFRRSLARRLLRAHWFVHRVVVERWFLHTHAPPLAGILARVG
jgi:flavin-dependent dehydrogenase